MKLKNNILILSLTIMLLTIPCINANNTLNDNQTNYDNLSYNDSLNQLFNKFSNKYNNSNNHTLLSFKNNDIEKIEVEADSKKLNKTRPIYFAMDHVNSNDREICDTITNKLKQEGFNVVSAEIGPNKMSQNTRKLYDQNISNAIIFHLFNGVDPSTIRELAKNGNDNRGRIVRNNGNDVILAWFYDSADCVNENGTATTYVYGSETGPSMENPKQYMIDNEIIAICTSSDNGKHKEDADYTGEQTVTEFIKLFHE